MSKNETPGERVARLIDSMITGGPYIGAGKSKSYAENKAELVKAIDLIYDKANHGHSGLARGRSRHGAL